MKKNLSLSTLFFFFWQAAFGQVSTVIPQKPTVKDTIQLIYNISAADAQLSGAEPVFARISNYMKDGSVDVINLQMDRSEKKFLGRVRLPLSAASFKVEFYTLNKEDDNAQQRLLVYDPERCIPVESAYLEAMFSSNPDSIFQKEMEYHPENYLAFARFMNVISMVKDPETAQVQIKSLISKIKNVIISDQTETNSSGLLLALCVGHAKTGNMNTAREYLFDLFNKFPLGAETAFAFDIYNYEHYKATGKFVVEEDIRLKLRELFVLHPDAAINANGNVFELLKNDNSISVQAFENVLLPLYKKRKIAYNALTNLPEIYFNRNVKADSAGILLNEAIKYFDTGAVNHQYRIELAQYQLYVPLIYNALARLNFQTQNYHSAITNSTAAIALLTDGDTEGNFRPGLLMLRAHAYQRAGNLNLAMEDYKRLFKEGDKAVVDSMKRIFPLTNQKYKTLPALLDALKPKQNNNPKSYQDFSATDLKGSKLRLADFKGKIVVLNAWGVGCGPCIAEMPELNKLVKHFSSEPNVVFLALTADKTETILKFLKNHVFNYTVLNNIGNMPEQFNTNSLPVHLVLGRNGEIIDRSIGAREDIQEYLKRIINNHL